MSEDWLPVDLAGSGSSNGALLEDLWAGQFSYAVFPRFLDESECDAVLEAVRTAPKTTFESGNALVSTIGVYLPGSIDDPGAYFAGAAELEPVLESILKLDSGDVRERIRLLLEASTNRPVVAATTPEGQEYGQGCIRLHGTGAGSSVHRDRISVDAPDWDVGSLDAQLSAVLMFQPAEAGGELRIYRQRWEPDDDPKFKNKGGLGWDPRVVDGAVSATYAPGAGDLYLLNSLQYHEVFTTRGTTDRVSMNFFIGFDVGADGPVVTFS